LALSRPQSLPHVRLLLLLVIRRPAPPALFPYTTLFRSGKRRGAQARGGLAGMGDIGADDEQQRFSLLASRMGRPPPGVGLLLQRQQAHRVLELAFLGVIAGVAVDQHRLFDVTLADRPPQRIPVDDVILLAW